MQSKCLTKILKIAEITELSDAIAKIASFYAVA